MHPRANAFHCLSGMVRNEIEHARLFGHVMVVRDSTGVFASAQHHQHGPVTPMHNALEAKVVAWNG